MTKIVPAFWVFRRAVFCAASLVALFLFPYFAVAQQPESLNHKDAGNILCVPTPADLSRQDVISGGPQITEANEPGNLDFANQWGFLQRHRAR